MTSLKKTLTVFSGTALFLNIVIGAGLLILPGIVYKQAQLHSIGAWVICGLSALPLIAVFIVLGKHYPDSGGISHYAKIAFGALGQRIASFLFLGAVIFGLPSIALTGAHYLNTIMPGSVHLYGIALICGAALLHAIPGKYVSSVLNVIGSSIILILILLLIIGGLGAWQLNPQPLQLLPEKIDVSIFFIPYMMIFFAFTGWEVGSHAAEEFKNPKRDFPLAMIFSFIIAIAFYTAIALIIQKSNISENYTAPFVAITAPILGSMGTYFVSVVAIALILANLYGALWGVSRLVYSLGRDGILPNYLSRVNKNGAPIISITLTVVCLLLVLMVDYIGVLGIEGMLSLSGQNFLALYGLAAMSLFKLTSSLKIKALSILATLLTGAIVAYAGIHLSYPLALLLLAILITKFGGSYKLKLFPSL